MKNNTKTICTQGLVVQHTFFDKLINDKSIINEAAINALKIAKDLGHEVAILAGQLYLNKGCVASSGDERSAPIALAITNTSMAEKGSHYTHWSILGDEKFREAMGKKLKELSPAGTSTERLH